jgi:adenylate kinase family enzyme
VGHRFRRVAIVASASGNGKTTLGHALADRLGVPFLELDALVHGPGWTELPDDELRRAVLPVIAADGWVVDGSYQRKLGTLVLDAADVVVWLDLPIRVWFPRLLARTVRRLLTRQELWNGNRESLKDAFWGRSSLFGYAFASHFRRRKRYAAELGGYRVVRLTTPEQVARWLEQVEPAPPRTAPPPAPG